MVVKYIEVVLATNLCKHKISYSDIGIVTPYRMQASNISEECQKKFGVEASNITIGTAAILQGQEKQIMIISTVSVSQVSDFAANFQVWFHYGNSFVC